MESIVISRKKLQAIVFESFSRNLTVYGHHVNGTIRDEFWFEWRAFDSTGNPAGPIYEIVRKAQGSRSLIDSLNFEDIIVALSQNLHEFEKVALWPKTTTA